MYVTSEMNANKSRWSNPSFYLTLKTKKNCVSGINTNRKYNSMQLVALFTNILLVKIDLGKLFGF